MRRRGRPTKAEFCCRGIPDVVPVDGQDWDTDPFEIARRQGRLYGRGTCDMKGFVGVALAHLPDFVDRGLETPLHLALSYDEEIGCIGVRRLIEQVRGFDVRPEMCVVGEPTDMKVVVAHKGKRSFSCDVKGMAAHSSLAPNAVNAVEFAAEIVSFIRARAKLLQRDGPFEDGFAPPHSTVHTGVIHGGTQLNIIPEYCSFQFEIRYLPFEDHAGFIDDVRRFAEDELLPEMKSIFADADITFSELSRISRFDHAGGRRSDPGVQPSGSDERNREGIVRHRGGVIQCGRYSDGGLRTGQRRTST